ncbi:MAG: methyltransferase [Burkholderiales bacterium]|uniref:CmcJ/NvfI family oxidoreductase n=1 Tax=Roseateles sp. TaxID=1971397 RepID=UPI000F99A00C|nr:MAG: methyltransferase [Burkholderiales bacterium]
MPSPCPQTPARAFVRASLGYIQPGTERPVNYMFEPPAGLPRESAAVDLRMVSIQQSRGSGVALDREGFELWEAPSQVRDFDDADEVRRVYHAECVALALHLTGGRRALVFDHLLRRREPGRPQLALGRPGDGRAPSGNGRVHNDYSEASGQRRLSLVLPDAAERRELGRFCILNFWRSIKGPVVDTPLAVCDARSVQAGDLVASEIRYLDRLGEIYQCTHAPAHRWHYFAEMDRHEVLVFKQYDSQASGVSRFTPHAAFDLPDVPQDAPLRESIEARCLVLF